MTFFDEKYLSSKQGQIAIFTGTLFFIVYFLLFDMYVQNQALLMGVNSSRQMLMNVKSRESNKEPYSRQIAILEDSRKVYLNFLGLRSYQENREILNKIIKDENLSHIENTKVDQLTYRRFTAFQIGDLKKTRTLLSHLLINRTDPWLVIEPRTFRMIKDRESFESSFTFDTVGYSNEE